MHVLIPFAAPLLAPSSAGAAAHAAAQALASLNLPALHGLLLRLVLAIKDDAAETTLSPPHERALAQALGWQAADGALPWAARWAAADGVAVADKPWGLITPTHWHLGTDQVSLIDPAGLMLDDSASSELFKAVNGLMADDGFELVWGHASRWYLSHSSLRDMPCASLDRVVGRNVDRWLVQGVHARGLRRLQSEVQMLLHGHPVNDAREARGLLPVNSFWLSGCGAARATTGPEPRVLDALRAPALANDWAAWAKAWQHLDDGPLAELATAQAAGDDISLTLCGERNAHTWRPAPPTALGGLMRQLGKLGLARAAPPVQQPLEVL